MFQFQLFQLQQFQFQQFQQFQLHKWWHNKTSTESTETVVLKL